MAEEKEALAVTLPGFEDEGGFFEIFLSAFKREDAVALRRVSGMIFGYNLEFRGSSVESGSAPDIREPFLQWRAIGRDLRYLSRYLAEFGGTFEETFGIDEKEARKIAGLAKKRAAAIQALAEKFEAEVEAAV